MILEEKKLSATEIILFFPTPLPLHGTFYATTTTTSNLQILQNIIDTNIASELLITSDFIYIKSQTLQDIDDLKAITFAELDDYISSPYTQTSSSIYIAEKCRIIIKTIIAPYLQKDGGDIEFISFNNGITQVRFHGKCNGCPYAQRTLKERVEKNLIRYIPEIKEAILV